VCLGSLGIWLHHHCPDGAACYGRSGHALRLQCLYPGNFYEVRSVTNDAVPLEVILNGIVWFVIAGIVTLVLLITFPEVSLAASRKQSIVKSDLCDANVHHE